MSRHYDRDAREILAEIAHGKTGDEYINMIWALRCPCSFSGASSGWPYKRRDLPPVLARPAVLRGRAIFEVIR